MLFSLVYILHMDMYMYMLMYYVQYMFWSLFLSFLLLFKCYGHVVFVMGMHGFKV